MKYTIEEILKVTYDLSEAYRGKITNHGGAIISTAYVLSQIQKSQIISSESLESFIETSNINHDVLDVIQRNLNGLWGTVLSFIGKYDSEILEYIVLYDNSIFEMSTPPSVAKLASRILNISSKDKVLDICSGSATFPMYAFDYKFVSEYTGIEINYNANDIAILRASLLGDNYSFIINNALTYNYPTAYDKIFSNYPFGLKGSDLDECRHKLQEHFDLKNTSISRCSSDWLFNATIIRNLKETGKAVAIMTNAAAIIKPDMCMRQFFVENGYIEAVINLPSKLFSEFSIPTTMIIFSFNNSSIKLINAIDIYSSIDKKTNILSEADIDNIIHCIKNDNEKTIVLTPKELRENEYNLMASHYLDKPIVENGVCFGNIIKNIIRGSQGRPENLESYKSVMPTNYRFINLSNVINGVINIEEGKQYLTELPKSLEKFVVPDNSIILSKMASPTFRSAVINTEKNQSMVATGNLYIIEIDESKANPYYIQAFFDSELGEATLNYASGGSITISAEAVKNIMIPLPPIEEQDKIAQMYQAALDEYAILKRKMQKVLERKRTLLSSEG